VTFAEIDGFAFLEGEGISSGGDGKYKAAAQKENGFVHKYLR